MSRYEDIEPDLRESLIRDHDGLLAAELLTSLERSLAAWRQRAAQFGHPRAADIALAYVSASQVIETLAPRLRA